MRNKQFVLTLLIIAIVTVGILFGAGILAMMSQQNITANEISLRQVSQQISGSGSIHSQQEATLTFQTPGKLVYLPFKTGANVFQGQTIAQLDTTVLEKQLQEAANAAEIAQNSTNQTQENQQASILEGQTRSALDTNNHNSYSAVTEAQVVTDTVNRLVANSLLTQNTAQLQVDLANYALQLASLTAPFTGIITHEDVTTPNVNITIATSFSIADPTEKVFRAEINPSDIDFISVGSKATITLDGQNTKITGTVLTIYPEKHTDLAGNEYYLVDIQADSPNGLMKAEFGQNGSVLIASNDQTKGLMVPTWTILGHNSIWVWNGQKAVLKTVTIGTPHGDMTEVTSGLSATDKVITEPIDIVRRLYQFL